VEYIIWNANPLMVDLGWVKIHWYGVLFVGSMFIGLEIFHWMYKREGRDTKVLENILLYMIAGSVIGARLAHCFFYEPQHYLSNPIEIFYVWEGGLASHGGLAGALIALWIFAKVHGESYFWLVSHITIPGVITAAFVRLGNLMNSEIVGNPTDVPWAFVFERVDMLPRHPVQLYEAGAYMALLGILLLIYLKTSRGFSLRVMPPTFLMVMFASRFFIEFTKSKQEAYTLDIPFSTGQLLSAPLALLGLLWLLWAIWDYKKSVRQ